MYFDHIKNSTIRNLCTTFSLSLLPIGPYTRMYPMTLGPSFFKASNVLFIFHTQFNVLRSDDHNRSITVNAKRDYTMASI